MHSKCGENSPHVDIEVTGTVDSIDCDVTY